MNKADPITWAALIGAAAQQAGVEWRWFSRDWVGQLRVGDRRRYLWGCRFDLNSHAAGSVVDDKYALSELLAEAGLPHIEHQICYPPTNHEAYAAGARAPAAATAYLAAHGRLVIKPTRGASGRDMAVVADPATLEVELERRWASGAESVVLSPWRTLQAEYRLVILAGQIRLVHSKRRPAVAGDGRRRVRELLSPTQLAGAQGWLAPAELERVPAAGEEAAVGWQFNLAQGGRAEPITEQARWERWAQLARPAAQLVNLHFGTCDIVETNTGEQLIMELNSGVMLVNFVNQHPDWYDQVVAIYADAIRAMFD